MSGVTILLTREEEDRKFVWTVLLVGFGRAVFSQNLEASDERDVHNLPGAVGLINEYFTPRWGEGHEVLVFHRDPPAISDVDQKRAESLGMQQVANLVNLHP